MENSLKSELKDMLKDLSKYIDGDWFVGDGALLGLVREKDLIELDNDIDIFLLPNAKLKLPKDCPYGIQRYYMDIKFYLKKNKPKKRNAWLEYLSYKRQSPTSKGLNRPQLTSRCAKTYKEEKIIPQFTDPYIDIFYLKWDGDKYIIGDNWANIYYTEEEVLLLDTNSDLGFDVPIPNNAHDILKRQYGDDYMIADPNFSYFGSK
tara:strand:- start:1 stop:615 length:615 start_codon:yes stop_codon:yes gene_type:complete